MAQLTDFIIAMQGREDEFEYEDFVKRRYELEINKRVTKQRLSDAENEFKEKFDRIRNQMKSLFAE